jgi:hypothetical protein
VLVEQYQALLCAAGKLLAGGVRLGVEFVQAEQRNHEPNLSAASFSTPVDLVQRSMVDDRVRVENENLPWSVGQMQKSGEGLDHLAQHLLLRVEFLVEDARAECLSVCPPKCDRRMCAS